MREAPDGALFCPYCRAAIVPPQPKGEPPDPMVGQTIKDAYIVQERIGVGGMGRVYRAVQISLGRSVALKLLRPALESDATIVQRFHREARACSRLHHPNVIQVLDFGQTEDHALFIVMEYVPGRSLFGLLRDEAPLADPRAIHLSTQILSALAEAHRAGIVHRDLKPENVMVESRSDEPEFVKVLDFGIAKLDDPGADDGQLTRTGVLCGTPNYMSPEQASLFPIDARSDLYSVGVILYEMLTGHLPFRATTPSAMAQAHAVEPPPPMSERCPPGHSVSPALEALVMKALEKDPGHRFQTAEEMRRELIACPLVASPGERAAPTLLQVPSPMQVAHPRVTPSSTHRGAPIHGAAAGAPRVNPATPGAGPAARTPGRASTPAPTGATSSRAPARPAPLTEELAGEVSPRSPAPGSLAPAPMAPAQPAIMPVASAPSALPSTLAPEPEPPAASMPPARARSRTRLLVALASAIGVLAAGAVVLTRSRNAPAPSSAGTASGEEATPRPSPGVQAAADAVAAPAPSPAAPSPTAANPAEPSLAAPSAVREPRPAEPAAGTKAGAEPESQKPAEPLSARPGPGPGRAGPSALPITASEPAASQRAQARPKQQPVQRSAGGRPRPEPRAAPQQAASASETTSAQRAAAPRPEAPGSPKHGAEAGAGGTTASPGPAPAPEAAAAPPPATGVQRAAFVTREVVSFQQVFGDPALQDRGRGLVGGAHWQLDPGGTLTFAPVTAAHGLFPMKVRATRDGTRVKFEGTSTARASDGLAYVRIAGLLALGAPDSLLTLDMEIGRALGPDGAELDPTYRARTRLRLAPE